MSAFLLLFLLLLDNGWSQDQIKIGSSLDEEAHFFEQKHEDELYNSEHGGDGQGGDFEEDKGSGSREVNVNFTSFLPRLYADMPFK